MSYTRTYVCAITVAMAIASPTAALAADQQAYPSRPIMLIVPWPAGAGTDVVQRAAAQLVAAELGRNIVVVNKPGAAGVIGAQQIENATADGYTLGGIASTVLLTQYTYANRTDWSKYEPIATLTYDAAAIAVRSDARVRTLKDLIEQAKMRPSDVKVGNSGTGGFHHVFAVMLEQVSGVTFQHVPYKGGSEIVVATLGGQLDAGSADTSALYAAVESGQLRLLGVAADRRQAQFPNVPTYREQGLNMAIGVRRLVVAPKGTPRAVLNVLERAYLKAARDPEFLKIKGGWQVDVKNAAETAAAMAEDDRMLKRLVDAAGLRAKN